MAGDEAVAPEAPMFEAVATRGDVRCTARVVDLGPRGRIATGLPFLDHMLDQLTAHAQLGVSVGIEANGTPLEPEKHYSAVLGCSPASDELERDITELAGQALGSALRPLLGGGQDSLPVRFLAPLDEGLSEVVLRPHAGEPSLLYAQAPFGKHPAAGRTRVGQLRLSLLSGFWAALARGLGASLAVVKLRGDNAHHIVESSFKAFARAVRACLDARGALKRPREEELEAPRRASHQRNTKETKIAMEVDLGGTGGASQVSTGLHTLDAMLSALASSSGLRLDVSCRGDLFIDDHHTTEDVCIALGQCLHSALGDKAGCNRMAWATAQEGGHKVEVAIDLSNRPHFQHDLRLDTEMVGDVSSEMVLHALDSLSTSARLTAHILHVSRPGAAEKDNQAPDNQAPDNPALDDQALDDQAPDDQERALQLVRATCTAYGRALGLAVAIDPRRAGSTASSKGTLSA